MWFPPRARHLPGPRSCGPCRRRRRRADADHRCYGAVLGAETHTVTWVSCPCGCLSPGDGDPDRGVVGDDTVRRILAADVRAPDRPPGAG